MHIWRVAEGRLAEHWLVLARDGAAVAIGFAHDERAAAAVVEGIERRGGSAAAVQADISDTAQVTRLRRARAPPRTARHRGRQR